MVSFGVLSRLWLFTTRWLIVRSRVANRDSPILFPYYFFRRLFCRNRITRHPLSHARDGRDDSMMRKGEGERVCECLRVLGYRGGRKNVVEADKQNRLQRGKEIDVVDEAK